MPRRYLLIAPTVAVLAMAASPALGHPRLEPYELPPGATADLAVLVDHGCGDESTWNGAYRPDPPTTGISLSLPYGVAAAPYEVDGWSVETEDVDGATTVHWRIDDPAGTTDEVALPLHVTLPDATSGDELWLPLVQHCVDDEAVHWEERDVSRLDAVPALRIFLNEHAPVPDAAGADADAASPLPTEPAAVAQADTSPETFRAPAGWVPGLTAGAVGLALLGLQIRRRRNS